MMNTHRHYLTPLHLHNCPCRTTSAGRRWWAALWLASSATAPRTVASRTRPPSTPSWATTLTGSTASLTGCVSIHGGGEWFVWSFQSAQGMRGIYCSSSLWMTPSWARLDGLTASLMGCVSMVGNGWCEVRRLWLSVPVTTTRGLSERVTCA